MIASRKITHLSINLLHKIRTLINQPRCILQRVKIYFQNQNEFCILFANHYFISFMRQRIRSVHKRTCVFNTLIDYDKITTNLRYQLNYLPIVLTKLQYVNKATYFASLITFIVLTEKFSCSGVNIDIQWSLKIQSIIL